MFKVGRDYMVVTLEYGEGGYFRCEQTATVTRSDGALIELNGCEIINTGSPLFHSAEDIGERARQVEMAEKRLLQREE